MSPSDVAGLVIAVLVFVYLVYALIHAERL
jgi:K+-transporting ATPase KdpF subunit